MQIVLNRFSITMIIITNKLITFTPEMPDSEIETTPVLDS